MLPQMLEVEVLSSQTTALPIVYFPCKACTKFFQMFTETTGFFAS